MGTVTSTTTEDTMPIKPTSIDPDELDDLLGLAPSKPAQAPTPTTDIDLADLADKDDDLAEATLATASEVEVGLTALEAAITRLGPDVRRLRAYIDEANRRRGQS